MFIILLSMIDNDDDRIMFEQLYKNYVNLIYHITDSILHDHYLAEDATQNALISIIKNFDKIKKISDESCIKGYIIIIAENAAYMILRKQKSQFLENATDDEILENMLVQDDTINQLEVSEELQKCFDCLPKNVLYYLVLKRIYGYTYSEIAKLYGISAATVRKRVERAIKLLKSKMEGNIE